MLQLGATSSRGRCRCLPEVPLISTGGIMCPPATIPRTTGALIPATGQRLDSLRWPDISHQYRARSAGTWSSICVCVCVCVCVYFFYFFYYFFVITQNNDHTSSYKRHISFLPPCRLCRCMVLPVNWCPRAENEHVTSLPETQEKKQKNIFLLRKMTKIIVTHSDLNM